MILDKYFKNPIFWDYLIAFLIVSIIFYLNYLNFFCLPKSERSLSMTSDLSNIGLTCTGFILTLLTVLITFKSSSKISKDNYEVLADQAFFDILQSYQGYRTCYYRTFNVGRATSGQNDAYIKARDWLDESISMIKPGVTTDKVAAVWPTAQELGFNSELEAVGLQFGHGLGLALHERPIISRAVSMENPMEIKTGMVFALETYCPASDGYSAARIEEEVVANLRVASVEEPCVAGDYPRNCVGTHASIQQPETGVDAGLSVERPVSAGTYGGRSCHR